MNVPANPAKSSPRGAGAAGTGATAAGSSRTRGAPAISSHTTAAGTSDPRSAGGGAIAASAPTDCPSDVVDIPSAAPTADLVAAVSRWYAENARDLPWRRAATSPWAVLVSEVMLAQTPVVRVVPAWTAWLDRWPGPGELAEASPGDVVRMWGKLGYPRRALRLRECAVALVRDHDSEVPDDVDALLALPGVGVYTARAVATFAFGQRHPVVDVNVRRVVARTIHGRAEPRPPSIRRDLADVEALLPGEPVAAARASIALMELGALVCTTVRPRCGDCPVTASCRWRLAGYPSYDGPRPRPQRFTGTDRQVRGRLLDVLRATPDPVARASLDVVWSEPIQRDRALTSLIRDGLVVPLTDDRYALPSH